MRLSTLKTVSPSPRHLRGQVGFTLVELMVSLVILGMIMTVVFSLFSTTSDGLKEADSLADTMDSARFALEQVSADMKSAGAFASPDAQKDPWVIQNTPGQLCVYGVAGYPDSGEAGFSSWQNSVDILSSDQKSAMNGGEAGVGVSYDGFIIMGARDYPQTFEVANIGHGATSTATIPTHVRGMIKLLANNPFYLGTTPPGGNNADVQKRLAEGLNGRLLRIADRDGYLQFSGITKAEEVGTGAASETGIELTLTPKLRVRQSVADGSANQQGLDPKTLGDEDVGYGAALVDAYWYHVEASPLDPSNFRLVRERLDARSMATALCDPTATGAHPKNSLPTEASEREKVVIADRVADFQVWFDCADAQGDLTNIDWLSEWSSPPGDSGGNCMDLSATPSYGAARMAHIRLSLRTRDERKDIPDHINALYQLDASNKATGPLRYFNVYPDAPGAARVVTVQSDIALTTFAMRNLQ